LVALSSERLFHMSGNTDGVANSYLFVCAVGTCSD